MGGYGSGRSGGQPTTESGLTLTLSKLLLDRLVRPGCAWGGSLVWTNTTTGERIGSIGYEAHLGEDNGRVRLHYTTTRQDGENTVSITGSSSKRALNPSAAGAGGSSALERKGVLRSFTCQTAPSFSHHVRPIGLRTNPSARLPTIELCGALLSYEQNSMPRVAMATTLPNRNGCAGAPTTVTSTRLQRLKRSSTGICWSSFAGSVNLADDRSSWPRRGSPSVGARQRFALPVARTF